MKYAETFVTMAVISSIGTALQCYHCYNLTANGETWLTEACEESEQTCDKDYNNTCLISKFSFEVEPQQLQRRFKVDFKGIQCSEGEEEEEQCDYLKSVMMEELDGDGVMEDFKCNVRFCATDLCTSGTSESLKTAQDYFLVLAFIVTSLKD